jgi:hypothetical protein
MQKTRDEWVELVEKVEARHLDWIKRITSDGI